ncbi:MAG: arylesterase [Bacteroidetes bacterium]|nr:arylesterase [Bacteroidota bacterium]
MLFRIFFIFLAAFAISCGSSEQNNSKNEPEDSSETNHSQNSDNLATETDKQTILFFGNSLTAGYGLDDIDQSFVSLIQKRIDSLGLDYKTVNAGLSGETTASGNSRIDWILQQKVDIFVLELGANDGLRGIDTEETRRNLQSMIDKVEAKYPEAKIVLCGMLVPPNMGQDYGDKFQVIYPELAEENDISLIPFLLDKVAGEPELNQGDGIHPTAEGHEIVAENVWAVLGDLF